MLASDVNVTFESSVLFDACVLAHSDYSCVCYIDVWAYVLYIFFFICDTYEAFLPFSLLP